MEYFFRNIVHFIVLMAMAVIYPSVVHSALVVRGANFTTLTAEARRMSFDGRYINYATTVGHLVNQTFPNPAGKIVFFVWSPYQHDWISPFVHNLSRNGAIGVIIAHAIRDDDVGGLQFYFGPYPGWKEVNIPIVAIKVQDFFPLQNNWHNTTLIAEFNCTDADAGIPEIETGAWYTYFIVVSAAAYSCGAAVVNGIVFFHLVQHFGFSVNITLIVTSFEALSCFWKFLAWAIDGVMMTRLTYIRLSRTMFYIPMPFSLSAGILLIFFWHETTIKSAISVNMWLGKFRIPAFILCALLFILDLVVEVSKFTPFAIQFVRAHIIVVAIIVGFLGAFYLVTSFRIFRAMGDSNTSRTDAHRKRVRRMTRRLVAGGVCYVALVVVSVIDAIDWSNSVAVQRGIILYNAMPFTHGRLVFFFRDLFMNTAAILTAMSFVAAVLRGRKKRPSASGSGTSQTAPRSHHRLNTSSSRASSDLTQSHSSKSKVTDDDDVA